MRGPVTIRKHEGHPIRELKINGLLPRDGLDGMEASMYVEVVTYLLRPEFTFDKVTRTNVLRAFRAANSCFLPVYIR